MSPPEQSAVVEVERIKAASRRLRGTIADGLRDEATGAIADADTQLTKFHGIYQQDDRDLRNERQQQRLEPAHSFMVRVRVPGGVCSAPQWLALDRLAREHANGTLRLTTRQAFQFHGVIKRRLKPTITAINGALLDTIAACGDVNRNVMSSPNPQLSALHQETWQIACRISERLTPRTRAYHEIWLDGERLPDSGAEDEPLYGPTYLPRKFKIGVAVPPWNDVDVYTQDLGFIAVSEQGRLAGFNVTVGGGMGATHGEPDTYPRLGDVVGFCTPAQAVDVAWHVVAIQRDCGDRTNRKHARFKYTIADRGLEWFGAELAARLGFALQPAREFRFLGVGDRYGWSKGLDGRWHLTLHVPSGRLADTPGHTLLSGMRDLAQMHGGRFRLTPNQNVIVAGVREADKRRIEAVARRHGLMHDQLPSALRREALSCVALPTCALAMAEAERYLPELVGRLETRLAALGLLDEPITLRVTGCPNGCARPYVAEIGLVGKGPGRYNLFLGGGFSGERLNRMLLENADETEILAALEPLLAAYALERLSGEHFGDFLHRSDRLSGSSGAERRQP
ncbi:MAG TPA: assimilatory sulfite reductase (NADPH) hemoprotein subunit [Gammaproteobacteria bacterium]|nr:assimilatory sulfite reductase (NADPH) hemoprotein subunit [Gammaproteobacteria bacterium]